jgi:crooked neck
MNYDAWFDLINLEIAAKNPKRIRETIEAAIKNIPLIEEKRYWRRYIYLWYSYVTFEELD